MQYLICESYPPTIKYLFYCRINTLTLTGFILFFSSNTKPKCNIYQTTTNRNIYFQCYCHIYSSETNMSIKLYIHAIHPNYTMCISDSYIWIYIKYEITDIKCVTRITIKILYKLHFTLFAYMGDICDYVPYMSILPSAMWSWMPYTYDEKPFWLHNLWCKKFSFLVQITWLMVFIPDVICLKFK